MIGSAKWYLDWFQKHFEHLYSISEAKNADYSTGGDLSANAFSNFECCEMMSNGKMSTVDGFLFRISDKFSRIITLLTSDKEQSVREESIDDTIDDMINYLMLLRAYRVYTKSKEECESSHQETLALPEFLAGDGDCSSPGGPYMGDRDREILSARRSA